MKLLNKFLNKQPEKEVAVKTKPKNKVVNDGTKKYPDVVYKIHDEFMTANEKTVKWANDILKKAEGQDIKKGKRLSDLGFGKTKEAVEATDIINKKQEAESKAKTVQYYNVLYPNNKFIFEDDIKKICEKYKLVFGNIEDYTGFVPEKNLKEIEGFEIVEADKQNIAGWNELTQDFTMKIVAPQKDFDMSGKMIAEDGYTIKQKTPPDPVVVVPVNAHGGYSRGYLICTAWGDESKDPLVVDQRKN